MNLFNICRVSFLFAWYDFWIGVYIDRKNYKVYILPIPMFGIVLNFNYNKDTGWNSI